MAPSQDGWSGTAGSFSCPTCRGKNVQPEGVGDFVVGKDKTSLSWVGVPLKASNLRGIIALGSYRPNAFDNGDLELLSNLAQHVSLALDNAYRHAQVEEQARL